jgi:hypothetical protein
MKSKELPANGHRGSVAPLEIDVHPCRLRVAFRDLHQGPADVQAANRVPAQLSQLNRKESRPRRYLKHPGSAG